MTEKEKYCMGRAEYLAEFEGYSLTEGYEQAEAELVMDEIEEEV